ncbi:early nodulin-like protein 1 [Pyrus x bretschneideri]|uniref:early nodulin-like protein 1 n=1 Tax=Pyrus x bretschneideri TaxID=225117 RepID=UPI00203098D6|nr:early nodulin-like protein 1 [Pyrus x bretschneideri]
MGSERLFLSIFLVILVAALASNSSQAYKFPVGGKDGWVLNPSESFNHWAERHRFQVNDTLFFKCKKGSNSVLVVAKEDYNSCNTKNPKQCLTDGDSVFKFNRSGPFFFISGNAENCQKGQKLIVVVLAVRNKTQHHTDSPSPSPVITNPPAVLPSPAGLEPNAPVQPPQQNSAPGSDVALMVFICIISIVVSTLILGNFVA